MASKEERERRRAERLAAERAEASAQRRRLILGYVVAGVLTLAVVVGLIAVIASSGGSAGGEPEAGDLPDAAHVNVDTGFTNGKEPDDREGTEPPPLEQGDLETAAEEAGCDLQLDLPNEGQDHVPDDELPEWDTNPPTSGNHSAQQQADGAWESVDPGNAVHSLEHGRIDIQYSPDLPESDQLELKGVFDESPEGVLFFPNPDMPYEVAATAWTQLLGCEKYEGRATIDAIRDFRDTFRGRGPENVPIVTG